MATLRLPVARSSAMCAFVLAAIGAPACGSNTDRTWLVQEAGIDELPDGVEGGEQEPGSEASVDPLYATSSVVWSPDGSALSYVLLLPSIERGVDVDYGDVPTFDEYIEVYARPGLPAIFVAHSQSPEITRFDIDDAGRVRERDTVSFAHLGLDDAASYPELNPILSETKAYLTRPEERMIAIWNPSDMTVTGEIDLDEAMTLDGAPEGFRPTVGARVVLRGGKAYLTVDWTNPDETQHASRSRVIVIDTDSDRVVDTLDEQRVTENWAVSAAPNGSIYFSSGPLAALARDVFGADHGSDAGLLRIAADGERIEPDLFVDLRSLVGGRPVGRAVPVADGVFWLNVRDAGPEVTPDNWSPEAWGNYYRWYRWEDGESSAVPVADQEPTFLGSLYLVEGQYYTKRYDADFTETTFVAVDPAGAFSDAITIRGLVEGLPVRLR